MQLKPKSTEVQGIILVTIAYVFWGILPIYWKMLQALPAYEIISHRIFWCFLFTLLLVVITGQWHNFQQEVISIIHDKPKLVSVILASLLLNLNWLIYVWAINHDQIVEASLGYYINPLVSVFLGIVVLKEKLNVGQVISFLLAFIGVLYMTWHFGSVPWVALTLAISFAIYGLVKKTVNVGVLTGLSLETFIISWGALLIIVYLQITGVGSFVTSKPGTMALLANAGIITAIPLLLFAAAASRLPLTIIGFIQYINPTITLLIGVLLYHEPFTRVHLVSFVFIWSGLIIFAWTQTRQLVQRLRSTS